VDWEYTDHKPTNKRVKKAEAKRKASQQKPKHSVVTPETKFLEIPVILRIPLSIGPVQITATE
jgi:hypothetical protein